MPSSLLDELRDIAQHHHLDIDDIGYTNNSNKQLKQSQRVNRHYYIIKLYKQEVSVSDIAIRLDVSINTVKHHIRRYHTNYDYIQRCKKFNRDFMPTINAYRVGVPIGYICQQEDISLLALRYRINRYEDIYGKIHIDKNHRT